MMNIPLDAPTDVQGIEVTMPRKKLQAQEPFDPILDREVPNFTPQEFPEMEMEDEEKKKKKHGFLRNLIGIIGDSFLIDNGHDAIYTPRLDQRNVSAAAKGFTKNPAAAAEAIADTGAPGSMDIAQTMFKNSNDAEIKAQNNQSLIQSREAAADSRTQGNLTKVMPWVGPLISEARDPADYSRRYERASTMLRRQGLSPDVAGLPRPEEWEPSMTAGYGMTSNQVAQDSRRDEQIRQTGELGQSRIDATRRGQDVSAATSRANTRDRVGATMRGQDVASRDRAAGRDAKSPPPKKGIPPVSPAVVNKLKSAPTPANMKAFDEYVGRPGAARAYLGKK